jgi:hypothetical protein
MAIARVLRTTTKDDAPLDASGDGGKKEVSDFLTIQSLASFAVMAGALTTAWNALQKVEPRAATVWVPYVLAFVWAFISVAISLDGLKKVTLPNWPPVRWRQPSSSSS